MQNVSLETDEHSRAQAAPDPVPAHCDNRPTGSNNPTIVLHDTVGVLLLGLVSLVALAALLVALTRGRQGGG